MSWLSALRIVTYSGIPAMPPHAHEQDVVCLPLAGSYVERTRRRETTHRLGDILFCPAGEAHAQRFPADPIRKLLMTATPEARDYLRGHLNIDEAPYSRSGDFASVAMRMARELRESDRHSELVLEGLGFELLALFARRAPATLPPPSWLRAAREHVLSAPPSVAGLADVARLVGREAGELAVAYRRAFGCTIGEDARRARLNEAARLLSTTRQPIADIAAECGFFDQAHLTRAFRRAFGLPPGRWRRSLN